VMSGVNPQAGKANRLRLSNLVGRNSA